jgi:hypothetical protein
MAVFAELDGSLAKAALGITNIPNETMAIKAILATDSFNVSPSE